MPKKWSEEAIAIIKTGEYMDLMDADIWLAALDNVDPCDMDDETLALYCTAQNRVLRHRQHLGFAEEIAKRAEH